MHILQGYKLFHVKVHLIPAFKTTNPVKTKSRQDKQAGHYEVPVSCLNFYKKINKPVGRYK